MMTNTFKLVAAAATIGLTLCGALLEASARTRHFYGWQGNLAIPTGRRQVKSTSALSGTALRRNNGHDKTSNQTATSSEVDRSGLGS
jgi:hypothetical protein